MHHLLLLLLLVSAFVVSIAAQKPATSDTRTEAEQIAAERKPQFEKLYKLIRAADRIVVKYGNESQTKTLFDSRKPEDIESFAGALRLIEPEEWRMSVCADPVVLLYKDGVEIVSIGDSSGREVKTSLWQANAIVADPDQWVRWFDDRGIDVVRKEYEHSLKSEREDAALHERWYAAMPSGIEELYEKQLSYFSLPSQDYLEPFLPILKREYPDRNRRIRALLHWYGSGSKEWDGSTAGETIAERILLLFQTREIVSALDSPDTRPTELEGAARLFTGWDFDQQRPNELQLIPRALKKRLLDHTLSGGIVENTEMAKKAFGR